MARRDGPSAGNQTLAVLAALVTFGVGLVGIGGSAEAQVTAVKGSACGYFTDVGLFGGPLDRRGCGQPADAPATGASPSVVLPPGGSATPITATDPDGATAEYGPASLFGGRWPVNVQNTPPSGPITVSTQGTPAGGTVTSSADIGLFPTPITVDCATGATPPCTAPGGFGPAPAEGDSLHVECSASETAVTGSTRFVNAFHTRSTDADGEPVEQEPVPDNPPVNYTRHGVITNVGDVFTTVYNEQIVNADGSLTVNAVHMYLFGPTAFGEVVKGSVTCGVTPSPLSGADTVPPTCAPLIVRPVSNTNPAPRVPRSELIGVFDARGLQSISNIQVTNGTVQVRTAEEFHDPPTFNGETGPVAVIATRTAEAEESGAPMTWSFDAIDMAGNTTHCPAAAPPDSTTTTSTTQAGGGTTTTTLGSGTTTTTTDDGTGTTTTTTDTTGTTTTTLGSGGGTTRTGAAATTTTIRTAAAAAAAAPVQRLSLSRTGSSVRPVAVLAVVSMALGLLLLLGSSRRAQPPPRR